jgi:hypothetical protein
MYTGGGIRMTLTSRAIVGPDFDFDDAALARAQPIEQALVSSVRERREVIKSAGRSTHYKLVYKYY